MDIRKRIESLFEKQELIGLTYKERQELRKLLEMKQEGK